MIEAAQWALVPGPENIPFAVSRLDALQISEYRPIVIATRLLYHPHISLIKGGSGDWNSWEAIWQQGDSQICIWMSAFEDEPQTWAGSNLAGRCRPSDLANLLSYLCEEMPGIWLHNRLDNTLHTPESFLDFVGNQASPITIAELTARELDCPKVRRLAVRLMDRKNHDRWEAAAQMAYLPECFHVIMPALCFALDDPDMNVRFYATHALGTLQHDISETLDKLIRIVSNAKEDPRVRGNAALAIGSIGKPIPAAVDALISMLQDRKVFMAGNDPQYSGHPFIGLCYALQRLTPESKRALPLVKAVYNNNYNTYIAGQLTKTMKVLEG